MLKGRYIELHPLTREHHEQLCRVVLADDLWKLPYTPMPSPQTMGVFIETALEWQKNGTALPFAIVDKVSGQVIGTTRLANYDAVHRAAEIGWTWLGTQWQRTAANTEAKYLLLTHAFEVMACIRVFLKTDVLNARSRAAIQRLGAREEGIFRRHMIMPDGRVRDSVFYSIIESEWPAVKAELERKLERR